MNNPTSIALVTTEYLPPISTFWLLNRMNFVYIEVCENYQKKSSRNRANILSSTGVNRLSVPLEKGKNNKMPISEVSISYDTKWISNHIHALKTAYSNAPFFEYYFDPIADILSSKHNLLLDLNTTLTNYFIEAIGLEHRFSLTDDYIHTYRENVLDLRKDRALLTDIIDLEFKPYNQVFEDKYPFEENLSIIDLLLCKGPESILYL